MEAGKRIDNLRKKARDQVLVVLVWGPGDPGLGGSPDLLLYWQKRNQIRDVLVRTFPNAEILFSESDALRDHTRDLTDLLAEELVHASIADCILVLDVSRGASGEVDRFTSTPDIAAKMTVLLPERWVRGTGLVSHVHKKTNVLGFSDEELNRCDVATKMSVSVVDTCAVQKLLLPRLAALTSM